MATDNHTTVPQIPQFLSELASAAQHPGVVLDDTLQRCIDAEAELRKLWATDRENRVLKDPYVGLVDVFGSNTPPEARLINTRTVTEDEVELSAKYIFPLVPAHRRKQGSPSTVADYEEFKKHWSIFTEGSLSQLFDWNNVVAAGGSVLACLLPLEESRKVSKREIRKYLHAEAYPTSDVDLFLWGMDAEQAEKKIQTIYEAVRDSVPWDVTCVRTKHTVSIHSQYPYRSVQIVLRLYQSPAEILAGFDIDAPCVAFDGQHVWANPRSIVAMMRQCNTVDMSRRSPSYEVRLTKYSARGFEVYVPTLNRGEVDPTIYERSIARIEGLARLLVLEKLITSNIREEFLDSRRSIRGRPEAISRYRRQRRRKQKGDLKADIGSIGGLEMNDYDVVSLHIPYGPGWDARRIEKLVYGTDLGMNSTFNPKNKGRRLHRHPAFFGTMEECLEDCCECCPKAIDSDERELQTKEDEQYIRGRLSFIEQDPGRQTMTGSFNPIDVGEWSDQTYISASAKLFQAIVANDRATVQAFVKSDDFDATRRDHVGRTPLHVAILCGVEEIACDLIDAGIRITARLVDGKAALHMAAQYNQLSVVKKLFQKSKENAEKKPQEDTAEDSDSKPAQPPPSSEDDWSSHDSDGMDIVDENEADDEDGGDGDDEDEDGGSEDDEKEEKKEETPKETGEMPEDEEEEPDIIDVNMADWDLCFTPLFYAVIYASLPVVNALLEAGADAKLVSQAGGWNAVAYHPLALLNIRQDQDTAVVVAERLIGAGASPSEADDKVRTMFHHGVAHSKIELLRAYLRLDKSPQTLLNFPYADNHRTVSPIVTAIAYRQYSVLAFLLAHGADMNPSEDDASKALEQRKQQGSYWYSGSVIDQISQPLEGSIVEADEIMQILISLGADVNALTRDSQRYASTGRKLLGSYNNNNNVKTLLDWVRTARRSAQNAVRKDEASDKAEKKKENEPEKEVDPLEGLTGWQRFAKEYLDPKQPLISSTGAAKSSEKSVYTLKTEQEERVRKRRNRDIRDYLMAVEKALLAQGAKTWEQLNDETTKKKEEDKSSDHEESPPVKYEKDKEPAFTFYPVSSYSYSRETVPQHTTALYHQLFQAAWLGNNEKIEELCLPKDATPATQSLLQVSVEAKQGHKNYYDRSGITPLSLAIIGRHWETARLILAIAAAQYKQEDGKFSVSDLYLDEQDDDDSDADSTCTDDTEEPPVKITSFKDVSQRKSPVQCSCSPSQLLMVELVYHVKSKTSKILDRKTGTHLMKAIETDDLELFTHMMDLYASVFARFDNNNQVFNTILREDLPDHLDEFIRRTGRGVHIEGPKDGEEDDIPHVINDANKLYLGLNVHGKKRADLAKKNDPNATQESHYSPDLVPLLWRAIQEGGMNIMEYLKSDRPVSAFKFYAKSRSDEKALRLRKVESDLPKILPTWHGWTITPLKESPLVAGVLGGKLDVIKKLFALDPALMKSALHEKVRFSGMNLINLTVAAYSPKSEIFDFFLSKGVSPVENVTTTGYNILHELANSGASKLELLDHVLKKLPKDTIEALMLQQSKKQNTPLHLAIKSRMPHIVSALLPFTSKEIFLSRDMLANTPLHLAASHTNQNPKICQLLLSAPTAPVSELLYSENGVGEIPLETLSQAYILDLTRNGYPSKMNQTPSDMSSYQSDLRSDPPFTQHRLAKLDTEISATRKVIAELTEAGTVKQGSKFLTEWLAWLGMMEARSSSRAKEIAADPPVDTRTAEEKAKDEKKASDSNDIAATLKVIREAMGKYAAPDTAMAVDQASGGSTRNLSPRFLVHISDVHTAVKALIDQSAVKVRDNEDYYTRRQREEMELLAEEEDEEAILKKGGLSTNIGTNSDPY